MILSTGADRLMHLHGCSWTLTEFREARSIDGWSWQAAIISREAGQRQFACRHAGPPPLPHAHTGLPIWIWCPSEQPTLEAVYYSGTGLHLVQLIREFSILFLFYQQGGQPSCLPPSTWRWMWKTDWPGAQQAGSRCQPRVASSWRPPSTCRWMWKTDWPVLHRALGGIHQEALSLFQDFQQSHAMHDFCWLEGFICMQTYTMHISACLRVLRW